MTPLESLQCCYNQLYTTAMNGLGDLRENLSSLIRQHQDEAERQRAQAQGNFTQLTAPEPADAPYVNLNEVAANPNPPATLQRLNEVHDRIRNTLGIPPAEDRLPQAEEDVPSRVALSTLMTAMIRNYFEYQMDAVQDDGEAETEMAREVATNLAQILGQFAPTNLLIAMEDLWLNSHHEHRGLARPSSRIPTLPHTIPDNNAPHDNPRMPEPQVVQPQAPTMTPAQALERAQARAQRRIQITRVIDERR